MRLALVTETFPPEVNGVARTLERWVEAFQRRGHHVQLIRPRQPGETPAPARPWGLPLPWYPEVRIGLAGPARLARLLRQTRPDLLHIATEGPLGWSARMMGRRLGIPTVTSFHTNFDQYLDHYGLGLLQCLGRAYLRWFHNCAAATFVPSEGTRRRLLELGVRRVEIWSRGVDCQAFGPCHRDPELRRSVGLSDDGLLLLYVGRLAREKNLDALLTSFGILRQRLGRACGDRLRLALVGGGPLAARLRGHAPPGVLLPGVQVGASLARWYASADLFAFPSRSETFGNVILEAMASGLPVVAFDGPGVGEQITHGRHGLLLPATQDLADGLYELCRDEGSRRAMAAAARRQAERQTWEPIFDRLEQRYYQIAQSAPLAADRAPRVRAPGCRPLPVVS